MAISVLLRAVRETLGIAIRDGVEVLHRFTNLQPTAPTNSPTNKASALPTRHQYNVEIHSLMLMARHLAKPNIDMPHFYLIWGEA